MRFAMSAELLLEGGPTLNKVVPLKDLAEARVI